MQNEASRDSRGARLKLSCNVYSVYTSRSFSLFLLQTRRKRKRKRARVRGYTRARISWARFAIKSSPGEPSRRFLIFIPFSPSPRAILSLVLPSHSFRRPLTLSSWSCNRFFPSPFVPRYLRPPLGRLFYPCVTQGRRLV